jgi:hypothetical protein
LDERYGDGEAASLAAVLARNGRGAVRLNVTPTKVTEKGARELAGALAGNDRLVSLAMEMGNYGRGGYLALAGRAEKKGATR